MFSTKRPCVVVALFAVLVGVASATRAEFKSPPLVLPTSGYLRNVSLVDLDGDDDADLVWMSDSGCFRQLSNGDGTFAAPEPIGNGGLKLAVEDLDADGILDLVYFGNGGIVQQLGDGLGGFGAPTIDVPVAPWAFEIGDLNGDTRPDLAVVIDPWVRICLANPSGGFDALPDINLGTHLRGVELADLDADGHLDMAVGYNDGRFGILLGHGDGTFAIVGFPVATNGAGYAEAVDLNRDGHLDLAVPSWPFRVLLGDGAGGFTAGFVALDNWRTDAIAVGDVTGDGRLDVVGTRQSPSAMTVLRGQGDGTFLSGQQSGTGSTPVGLALGDVNDDGLLDAAVANQGSGSISVFLNTGAPVDIEGSRLPARVQLAQSRPNPAAGALAIEFALPSASVVGLCVYDPAGRRVATLASGSFGVGMHRVTWDGRNDRGEVAGAGVYFYCLDAGGERLTKRLVLRH